MNLVALIIAVVCFAIALLLALGVVSGGNDSAWIAGGLLAFAVSFLPWASWRR